MPQKARDVTPPAGCEADGNSAQKRALGSGSESEEIILAQGKRESASVTPRAPAETSPALPFWCPICIKRVSKPTRLHAPTVGSRELALCVCCAACFPQWNALDSPVACPVCSGLVEPDRDAIAIEPPQNTAIINASCEVGDGECGPAVGDSQHTCGICEVNQPTSGCIECGFNLCAECVVSSHGKGKFKQHHIVAIGNAPRATRRPCAHHPGHALEIFCHECRVCGCALCCLQRHRDHRAESIESAATEAAAQLKHQIEAEVVVTARDAAATSAQTEASLIAAEKGAEALRLRITSTFATLRRALEEREAKLLADVAGLCVANASTATELMKACSATVANAQQCEEVVRSSIEQLHPADFLRLAPLLATRIGLVPSRFSRATDGDTHARVAPANNLIAQQIRSLDETNFFLEKGQTVSETLVKLEPRLRHLGKVDIGTGVANDRTSFSPLSSEAGSKSEARASGSPVVTRQAVAAPPSAKRGREAAGAVLPLATGLGEGRVSAARQYVAIPDGGGETLPRKSARVTEQLVPATAATAESTTTGFPIMLKRRAAGNSPSDMEAASPVAATLKMRSDTH